MSAPNLHGYAAAAKRRGSLKNDTVKKASPLIKKDPKEKEEVVLVEPLVVQAAYHRAVDYGDSSKLNVAERQAFLLVKDSCNIPDDFTLDKSFGPLSSVCFEQRVIAAYRSGLLKEKNNENKTATSSSSSNLQKNWPVPVCTQCGTKGHWKDDCSSSFDTAK